MPALSPSRILRAATSSRDPQILLKKFRKLAQTKTDWSETLALPKSSFPARPSAEDLQNYRQRCADDLYQWQRTNRPDRVGSKDNEFVLHDGPPYANGAVHVGHALNKVTKDVILRWELSTGKRVKYRPGWDCHGLPIELKALQQPKTPAKAAKALKDAPAQEAKAAAEMSRQMTAPEIRAAARKLASETIESQKKSFREWGVMGEWDTPYTTMSEDFEVRQLGVFREMVRKGLISRHHRPVYWSPSSRTALAEAELEYDDKHKCTAAFVKIPFVQLPPVLQSHPAVKSGCVSALIWTTTPWTLPANQAIAVNGEMEYSLVELLGPGETFSPDHMLVAKDRIEHVLSFLPEGSSAKAIIETIPGSQLSEGDAACFNIFTATKSPVLKADFVTASSGTGLVHMAPGHGMEDYQVCQRHGITSALAPVDDEGRYTADAFPASDVGAPFRGLDVQTQGVKAVLAILAWPDRYLLEGVRHLDTPLVLATHTLLHKNPIDWRTKQPVITRATAQWFADVSAIKDRAMAAIHSVKFIPGSGKTRLQSFVEGRSQWCISRQRAWGVPIPALYHADTGEACISNESISHIIRVIGERGTDAWFADAADEPAWLHSSLPPGKWIRGKDTMDVWFDSGTSWTSLEKRDDGSQSSDVYLEGTDQHRGWFQSSLLTAIATQDSEQAPAAPFRTLATHGFTLDGEGRKMSKSLGNVISPEEIMSGALITTPKGKSKGKAQQQPALLSKKAQQSQMGPDLLRLWVASSDYTRDVSISQPVLQSVQQALQKYRVTFKFLLGVLRDYPGQLSESVPASSRSLQDELPQPDFAETIVSWRLSRCTALVSEAFKEYKFHAGVNEINKFINNDLSAFYFEIIKDRLYAGPTEERRRTQAHLAQILFKLSYMLRPITPHLIQEVQECLPPGIKQDQEQRGGHLLRDVWQGGRRSTDHAWWLDDMQEKYGESFEAFNAVSSAVKIAQEELRRQKKLGSGLACDVVLVFAGRSKQDVDFPWFEKPTSESEIGHHSSLLADLLVVSRAAIRNERDCPVEGEFASPWRWGGPFEFVCDGKTIKGKVIVLSPSKEKCVRCWKYTAEEENVPCERCRDVLAEQMNLV